MNTVAQSVLSTNYLQILITTKAPAAYNPTGDTVAMSSTPLTYPETSPTPGSRDRG